MEPAQTIIRLMGGPARVSEITGTAYTAPYRWQSPREKGGTDGLIPQKYHLVLLKAARDEGIELTPMHFFPVPPVVDPQEAPAAEASTSASAALCCDEVSA